MQEVKQNLKEREEELLNLKKHKQKALHKPVPGTLRISCEGNRVQYYQRSGPKDINGTYIRSENKDLACKIAQKDYDQKVLQTAEKELSAIRQFLRAYPENQVEEIYEKLHKERQKLVIPIKETDEQFLARWQSLEYEPYTFWEDTPEFYTEKGERVRSKSELIIANLLHKENIPYRYECPLYLRNFGKVHPDFTVLNLRTRKEYYWEHLGLMDEPSYAERSLRKISAYEEQGFFLGETLIITYETAKYPLDQKQLQRVIQRFLK